MTKVLDCNCPNEQQDKIHGKNRRVHNKIKRDNPITFRCTVCSNEKSVGNPIVIKKK